MRTGEREILVHRVFRVGVADRSFCPRKIFGANDSRKPNALGQCRTSDSCEEVLATCNHHDLSVLYGVDFRFGKAFRSTRPAPAQPVRFAVAHQPTGQRPARPPFQPNAKFLGVFPLPWWGLQASATMQSVTMCRCAQADASGRDWRTTSLWGLSMRTRFLHDGRARTVEAAILAHGGEADAMVQRFRALPGDERAALLAFLNTL